jgi:hypothetical protein
MKELFYWIMSALFLSAIIATEVYDCQWNSEGEYKCNLISSPPPEEINSESDLPFGLDVED